MAEPETYGFRQEPEDLAISMLGEKMSALDATLAVLTEAVQSDTAATEDAAAAKGGKGKDNGSKGDSKEGGEISGAIGKLFTGALAKIAIIFGPLISLSAVLNSVTSGFQPMLKAAQVLAAVLGTVLLPFFLVLGAALLTASDVIFAQLKPALGSFYEFVITALKPAFLELLAQVEDLAEGIGQVMKWIGRNKGTATAVGSAGSAVVKTLGYTTGAGLLMRLFSSRKKPAESTGAEAKPPEAAGKPEAPKPGPSPREQRRLAAEKALNGIGSKGSGGSGGGGTEAKFNQNLKVMIESFARSMGPKASYQSIADANKQIQLAAMNQDPIDAKMLNIQQLQLEELRKIGATSEPQPTPRLESPGSGGRSIAPGKTA